MPPKDITQTGPVSYRELQEANTKNPLYKKMLSSLSDAEKSTRETYFRQKEFHDTVAPALGTAQLAEETGLPESVVDELSYNLTASGYSTDQIKRLLKNYYTAAHPQEEKPETSTEEVEDTRAPWERQPSYDFPPQLTTLPKFDLEAATKSIEAARAREAEEQKVYNDALAEYHRDHPYSDSFASEGINLVNMDIDREAEAYAKEKLAEFKQIVPESQNPYRGITTTTDVKNRISELSSSYNKLKGSAYLPENEINYDEIYRIIAPLIAQNRPSAVENAVNDYIEGIAGEHQQWYEKLLLGAQNAAGNLAEGLWEYEALTNIAALGSGLVTAAINPDDYQLESGMDYWDRVLDKARHARFGYIGPGAAKEVGDAIRAEEGVYGNDAFAITGRAVLPLMGYLTSFAIGGLEDLMLTGGTGTLSKTAAKSVVKSQIKKKFGAEIADDVLERCANIVERKAALYHNKSIRAGMTVHAASAEALGEASQVEEEIMNQGARLKDEIRARIYNEAYNNPNSYEYSEEELQSAAQEILDEYKEQYGNIANMVASQISQYQAANPDVPVDVAKMSRTVEQSIYQDMMRQAQARAAANHALERQGQIIDMAYKANASKMGNATWLAETIELAFMEGVLGGAQSRLMPFRLVKNNMKPSDLSKFVTFKNGKFQANLPTGKQIGNALFERGKDIASEVIQEGPMQGFTSSYLTYKGSHSAEEFVNNHFFGDGALSMEHYTRNNPSLQELVDDSRLGDVMFETAISTALAGSFSPRRSFREREARREGESKFRYAVKNISDYLPFDTPITQTVSDIMHQNDEVHDVVNWLNNYYSNPKNQDKIKSVRAFSNYALNLQRDVDNNDAVSYENDAFSMTLAEAIMLSRLSDSPIYQSRIQQLQNMKSIKSGTDEEKADAIKDWREHVTTADAAKLSDEQILDVIEENGNRVLNLFEKVNKQNEILDRTYGTNLSFEDRAMRLFGIFAQEDLQSRIKDKQNYIDGMAKLVEDEDLGETRESKFSWGKRATYKNIQMSGQDIMRLPNLQRFVMLDPRNLSLFSEEQQKIITSTLDALRSVDKETTIEQDIEDIATLEGLSKSIKQEYRQTLKNFNKPSKKFKQQKQKTMQKVSDNPDKNARKFQDKATTATSVQELRSIYDQEVAANEERKTSKKFDVEKALHDISDPETRKKVEELDNITRAQNSLKTSLSTSSLPEDVKQSMYEQIDGVANAANTASILYDISNYRFNVSPDKYDETAGQVQEIINEAKVTASTAQSVDTEPITEQNGPTQAPDATDLSDKDVDTAPPVNAGPVKPTEPEPVGPVQTDIDLEDNGPTFAEPETIVDETLEEGEVVITDHTLDSYPDDDPRSITNIAIVDFEEGGTEYAYPIRDEDVKVGDNVVGKSGSQGRVKRITRPEVYTQVRQETGETNEWTVERLAKEPRPQFINRHQPAEPTVATEPTSSRTKAQQARLDNSITPARNEIAPQFLPRGKDYTAKEAGKEYFRLSDEDHHNIDSQLDEQGAFEYRNNGSLEVGDDIQFVVSEEEMPDGTKQPVIWEVTTPKGKTIPEDSKFKGKQVLSVLDQTDMFGDRAELISRIRRAYDEAGRPESFLYDKETFKVQSIVNGVIPFQRTNPADAQTDATIESTNLKKGFTKKDGKYGASFWSKKRGSLVHTPVILKQIVREPDGTVREKLSHSGVNAVETIKHTYASQNETREVMLVMPTATGWKSTHSVYVMRRDIPNAVDKYKEAIRDGELGKRLISKIEARLTDMRVKTSFSDFLRFSRDTSEQVRYDPVHGRLELGYRDKAGMANYLLYANKRDDSWYITGVDAREVLDDNDGKGYSFEDICKMYLDRLVENEDLGASVQINMDAITKDNSILDALIDDGFLWAPNSIDARFGMENTGFSAPLNENIETPKTPAEPVAPTTAPVEKTPTADSVPINQPKRELPERRGDTAMRVKRKKLTVETAPVAPQSPSTPTPEPIPDISTEIKNNSQLDYSSLSDVDRQHVISKGFTAETWNSLTPSERENVLNC